MEVIVLQAPYIVLQAPYTEEVVSVLKEAELALNTSLNERQRKLIARCVSALFKRDAAPEINHNAWMSTFIQSMARARNISEEFMTAQVWEEMYLGQKLEELDVSS